MIDTVSRTPNQVARLLKLSLLQEHRPTPLLLEGQPGVGKSSICRQSAAAVGYRMVTMVASLQEASDFAGWLWYAPGEDRAKRVPAGELAEATLGGTPTLLLLDDLAQAAEDALKAAMHLLHAVDTNLPPYVRVVGATNRRQDRAGAIRLLSPVQNRVTTVRVMPPNPDDWIADFALDAGMPEALIAYQRWGAIANRDGQVHASLCSEPPAEGGPYPTPRSWESVGRRELAAQEPQIIAAGGYSDDDLYALNAGDVGEPEAAAYAAFRTMYQDAVFADEVFVDPKGARLPDKTKPALAAGLVAGLVGRLNANATTPAANAVAAYLVRLVEEGWVEYAAYSLGLIQKHKSAANAFCMCQEANRLRVHPGVQGILYGSDHR